MGNWTIEIINDDVEKLEIDLFEVLLQEKAKRIVYCVSDTCYHFTHPVERLEVSHEDIEEVLKELNMDNYSEVEKIRGDAICFDYFLIKIK